MRSRGNAKNLEARMYFRYHVDKSLPAMHQQLHDKQTMPCVFGTPVSEFPSSESLVRFSGCENKSVIL